MRQITSRGSITANASYLSVAIMSGIFDPTFGVPRWLSAVIGLLPVRALAQIRFRWQ